MNLINQTILSVVIVLALESCGANNDKSKEEKFYLPLVEIASAERKQFTHEITAQGNVESAQDILLLIFDCTIYLVKVSLERVLP